jgi:hypothetical protein
MPWWCAMYERTTRIPAARQARGRVVDGLEEAVVAHEALARRGAAGWRTRPRASTISAIAEA